MELQALTRVYGLILTGFILVVQRLILSWWELSLSPAGSVPFFHSSSTGNSPLQHSTGTGHSIQVDNTDQTRVVTWRLLVCRL